MFSKKQSVIKHMDIAAIILLILWGCAYGKYNVVFPIDMLFLAVPFIISVSAIFLNLSMVRDKRVPAYKFGFMCYWHPYCTFLIIISIFLIIVPGQEFLIRILHIIGTIIILFVAIWAFLRWLTH